MAVVYRHRRLDDFSVFYVGIGDKEYRSRSKHNRSDHWKRIVKNHGYVVEIVANGIDYDTAKELEMEMILQYGRRFNNTGRLVNITEGGDGTLGFFFKHKEETRLKMNKEKIGIPRTKDAKLKISMNHAKSRVVINTETGEEYRSCADLSRKIGVNQDTLSEKLRGRRKNNTVYKYKITNNEAETQFKQK